MSLLMQLAAVIQRNWLYSRGGNERESGSEDRFYRKMSQQNMQSPKDYVFVFQDFHKYPELFSMKLPVAISENPIGPHFSLFSLKVCKSKLEIQGYNLVSSTRDNTGSSVPE
ncbi:hypothetical protein LOAG_12586 [Loa loa]|uniref:Uncharacterized protein n=1 Tax=Loa loa TaxID=7209 RepID=A0A1S0TKX7_LOALO|nr:hypothetical protein LOAG_12586 [Loa loa]EFO15923.1 hypothetical protein LOAG_12586 [Loa loa]